MLRIFCKMPTRGRAALAVGLSLLCALPACAQSSGDDGALPAWRFAGYGSAGVVHSSEKAADFTANVLNPGRAGYSRAYSYDVDSRLAGQLNFSMTPAWSAVLQVVVERNMGHDFSPAIEWANLSYRYSPELSVRVGRIALPVFLLAEYRKASYALPWVRPPVEVYFALPLSNSDGIDASYRWRAGGAHIVTQLSLGRTSVRLSDTARFRGRELLALSNTVTLDALTVRASVLTNRLEVDVAKPLFDAFAQFGPAGQALADKYDASSKRTSVATLGFNYDPGHWFLMGELGRFNARSFLGNKSVAYLSSGVRYGAFTPYVTYSTSRANQPTTDAGLALTGLAPQAAARASFLNAQLNLLLSKIAVQHTSSAGVRWDFMPDRSLKLQYDRLRPDNGTSGTLINVQPAFRSGHRVHAVSAMLDVVF
jgi:hypothetical protein